MPTGINTTDLFTKAQPLMINSARQIREQKGGIVKLVDVQTLPKGTGLSWREVDVDKIYAQREDETTVLDNPQQFEIDSFSITPTSVAVYTVITDRLEARISEKVLAKLSGSQQKAIQRIKEQDGIALFSTATHILGGAGVTMQSDYVAAAVRRITSNTVEAGDGQVFAVMHGFQIRSLEQELTNSVGTFETSTGLTKEIFQRGWRGAINGAQVYENGHLPIDSGDDAVAGVFVREAIVLVEGRSPRNVQLRNEKLGGGSYEIIHRDEYAFGERSPGNWLFGIRTDASVPA